MCKAILKSGRNCSVAPSWEGFCTNHHNAFIRVVTYNGLKPIEFVGTFRKNEYCDTCPRGEMAERMKPDNLFYQFITNFGSANVLINMCKNCYNSNKYAKFKKARWSSESITN